MMARLVSTVKGVVTTVVARSAARKPVQVFSATYVVVVDVNDGTVSVIVSSIDRPTVHFDLLRTDESVSLSHLLDSIILERVPLP